MSDVGDLCRIAIVDDEFIMRQGIKHMLDWEKEGFEIAGEASNGKEGLELIRRTQPHILLCDIVMPVMDGLDLVKIVHTEFADMQIIILSGYDDFKYVKETLLNGAADYILKPALSPRDLLKSIQKAAERIPGLQLKRRDIFWGMKRNLNLRRPECFLRRLIFACWVFHWRCGLSGIRTCPGCCMKRQRTVWKKWITAGV